MSWGGTFFTFPLCGLLVLKDISLYPRFRQGPDVLVRAILEGV